MRKYVYNLEAYARDVGVDENFLRFYTDYAKILIDNKVPVIFEFDHLALLLGREHAHLASLINSTRSHYRTFKIRKRSGGRRLITAPYPSLLECQRWILKNILESIRVHRNAYGFIQNRSIVDNAKCHLNKKEMIKIDIEEFFPSFGIGKLIKFFMALGYARNVAFYLSSICSLNEKLPQGAATSPYLSNIFCLRMDKRISAFARNNSIKYTRYADDITFSGERVPKKAISFVSHVLADEGLKINFKKTKILGEKDRKYVTGIDVTERNLRLKRTYKREIFQELYYIEKFGFLSHVSHTKLKNDAYLNSILGKISFIASVEGNSDKLKKYHKMIRDLIRRYNSNHNYYYDFENFF